MKRFLLPLFFASLCLVPAVTHAQWHTYGNVIVAPGTIQYQNPQIVADGAGGAIVTWQDFRAGNTSDVYAQRISAWGTVQWQADGVPICTAPNNQSYPGLIADGAGGAIIVWTDYRSGTTADIYAQHIDATGNAIWAANGIGVCTATASQLSPAIVSDGAGGVIVAWFDTRAPSYNIYAQRVDASGTKLWGVDGFPICTALNEQRYPTIVSDGAGGAIIAWQDLRNDPNLVYKDIYAQRVDPNGSALWTVNGVAICTADDDQVAPAIVSDGAGGGIIVWNDYRYGSHDTFNPNENIFAQRVNASGTVQWTTDGIPVVVAPDLQVGFTILADGAGGAVVAWHDHRNGSDFDIYAQRIDASGASQWTANGLAVCTAANTQYEPSITTDGTVGGVIVSWADLRSGTDYDVYAQHLNPSGTPQWTAGGVDVCAASDGQLHAKIASDGVGGAILAWQDQRAGINDIYSQRIEDTGSRATGVGATPPATALTVRPNYPNPFNAETRLEIGLAESAPVRIDVYDVTGRRVRTTELSGVKGWQEVPFVARDDRGAPLASGIYFYRVQSRGTTVTRKMVVMR